MDDARRDGARGSPEIPDRDLHELTKRWDVPMPFADAREALREAYRRGFAAGRCPEPAQPEPFHTCPWGTPGFFPNCNGCVLDMQAGRAKGVGLNSGTDPDGFWRRQCDVREKIGYDRGRHDVTVEFAREALGRATPDGSAENMPGVNNASPTTGASPFSIREEAPGVFRVYVFSCGLYPTGTREDAERLLRSLEHDRAAHNRACNAELADLRALLARAVELFGDEQHIARARKEEP